MHSASGRRQAGREDEASVSDSVELMNPSHSSSSMPGGPSAAVAASLERTEDEVDDADLGDQADEEDKGHAMGSGTGKNTRVIRVDSLMRSVHCPFNAGRFLQVFLIHVLFPFSAIYMHTVMKDVVFKMTMHYTQFYAWVDAAVNLTVLSFLIMHSVEQSSGIAFINIPTGELLLYALYHLARRAMISAKYALVTDSEWRLFRNASTERGIRWRGEMQMWSWITPSAENMLAQVVAVLRLYKLDVRNSRLFVDMNDTRSGDWAALLSGSRTSAESREHWKEFWPMYGDAALANDGERNGSGGVGPDRSGHTQLVAPEDATVSSHIESHGGLYKTHGHHGLGLATQSAHHGSGEELHEREHSTTTLRTSTGAVARRSLHLSVQHDAQLAVHHAPRTQEFIAGLQPVHNLDYILALLFHSIQLKSGVRVFMWSMVIVKVILLRLSALGTSDQWFPTQPPGVLAVLLGTFVLYVDYGSLMGIMYMALLHQKRKQQLLAMVGKAIRIADEPKVSLPLLNMRVVENVRAWLNSRIVFQLFGERYEQRLRWYTTFSFVFMVVLVGYTVAGVIDNRQHARYSAIAASTMQDFLLTTLMLSYQAFYGARSNGMGNEHKNYLTQHLLHVRNSLSQLKAASLAENEARDRTCPLHKANVELNPRAEQRKELGMLQAYLEDTIRSLKSLAAAHPVTVLGVPADFQMLSSILTVSGTLLAIYLGQ